MSSIRTCNICEQSWEGDADTRCPFCGAKDSREGVDDGPIQQDMFADLPDPKRYVHRDAHDTERDAAQRVDATTWRNKCYQVLRAAGAQGVTAKEAHEMFGGHDSVKEYSIRPRFTDLKDLGLAVDSGMRRNRNIVWVTPDHKPATP
jgi:hypothetical protein